VVLESKDDIRKRPIEGRQGAHNFTLGSPGRSGWLWRDLRIREPEIMTQSGRLSVGNSETV
jgi:hypothetical protein